MTNNPKASWPFAPGEAPEPTAEELEAEKIAEQQKLIEVLKFTPRTYQISLWGYGGEYVMGTVDRKIYDYFKSRRLDVSDFAWNSDYADEHEIPEDMWPFPPGSWYECDNIAHVNGVDRNSGSIQITDENGNTVFEKSLEDCDGYSNSPEWQGGDEAWIDSEKPGTVVFIGVSSEKGTFFEGSIELRAPFDIEKLILGYDEVDGNEIVSSVYYDDQDIDNDGGSTDGKSSDFGFYVAGTQQDGNWERYRNMDDIEYPMTEWFDKKVNPQREGIYEIKTPGRNGYTHQAKWTGSRWINSWHTDTVDTEELKIKEWRGLSIDPDSEGGDLD